MHKQGAHNNKAGKPVHDSREVSSADAPIFFAITGYQSDGHEHAQAALQAGATAIVAEHEIPGIPTALLTIVENSRIALAHAAADYFENPGADLAITGVTGTNGKTTTIYLLDAIARAAGEVSGLIGTVETRFGECVHSSKTTTPDALALQELLATMRDAGVESVAMEVSSHAIDLHRVEALPFAVVAFTNLSQDHLDYHKTMEEYRAVKEGLFTDYEAKSRVINIDDKVGAELAARLEEDGYEITTVGIESANEPLITARDCRVTAQGTDFTLRTPDGALPVSLPLMGDYNLSNALVAAACSWCRGISPEAIAKGLSQAPQVPGRLERVNCGQPFAVLVDYAHTPDALRTALAALRPFCAGRLITVFGCGGDRDPKKRPLMAQAAGEGSDLVVATSDNPRSEDPDSILRQVVSGLKAGATPFEVIRDRRSAIEWALSQAQDGDCVLIAGKGHEDYQLFADRTIHFDDREVARDILAAQGYEARC